MVDLEYDGTNVSQIMLFLRSNGIDFTYTHSNGLSIKTKGGWENVNKGDVIFRDDDDEISILARLRR